MMACNGVCVVCIYVCVCVYAFPPEIDRRRRQGPEESCWLPKTNKAVVTQSKCLPVSRSVRTLRVFIHDAPRCGISGGPEQVLTWRSKPLLDAGLLADAWSSPKRHDALLQAEPRQLASWEYCPSSDRADEGFGSIQGVQPVRGPRIGAGHEVCGSSRFGVDSRACILEGFWRSTSIYNIYSWMPLWRNSMGFDRCHANDSPICFQWLRTLLSVCLSVCHSENSL